MGVKYELRRHAATTYDSGSGWYLNVGLYYVYCIRVSRFTRITFPPILTRSPNPKTQQAVPWPSHPSPPTLVRDSLQSLQHFHASFAQSP